MMKTIKERLTCIEVQLKYIKKLIYVILVALGASVGIDQII